MEAEEQPRVFEALSIQQFNAPSASRQLFTPAGKGQDGSLGEFTSPTVLQKVVGKVVGCFVLCQIGRLAGLVPARGDRTQANW